MAERRIGEIRSRFASLHPPDRAAVAADHTLIKQILELDVHTGHAIVRELRPARPARLKLVSDCAPAMPVLLGVLHSEAITSAGSLASAAAELKACPAFLSRAVLDPLIHEGTAIEQVHLAATGEALLKAVYPGQTPIEIFPALAADLAAVRDAFQRSPSLRTWLLAKPEILQDKIVAAGEGFAWARLLWSSPSAPHLARWIMSNQASWGGALVDGLNKEGTSADAAVLKAANNPAAAAAIHAMVSGRGTASLLGVLARIGMSLVEQLRLVDRIGHLDAKSVPLIIDHPGVTAQDQLALAHDDAAIALIRKAMPSQRADQALAALAANPKAFSAALSPPGTSAFASWVLDNRAQLWATMSAHPNWEGWIDAFKQLDAWAVVLDLAADPAKRATLRSAVVKEWNWFITAMPHPVSSHAHAQTILDLYADGSGIKGLHDKLQTWSALYRAELAMAGNDRQYDWGIFNGKKLEETYVAVTPDEASMNLFFHQFRQMPRVHVDTAAGLAMVHTKLSKTTDVQPPHQVNISQAPILTSYYIPKDNWIVMRSTSATSGTPDEYRPADHGQSSSGVNTPGIDPLSEGAVKPMTMFQNHATHEVGHAVGQRTMRSGNYNIKGDDFALYYGGWAQNGSRDGYAMMCGWSGSDDSASYNLMTVANQVVQVPGWAIRSFLTGVIECGAAGMNGDGLVTHLGGNATYALDAIDTNPMLHGSLLVRNVRGAVDYNALPDAAYAIQNGIVGPKVHFFSTRWGNRWVTYDAVCWHDRASHYAVSSPMEMFAEMYTKKFTGGGHGMPRANNGWDPGTFFHALEQADPVQLGLPADTTKQPAPGASRPGAGAPAAAPPTTEVQGPSAPPPGKAIPLS